MVDTKNFLELFVTEATDFLGEARKNLESLQSGGSDPDRIGELFRHAHSLKGMAACMGFQGLVDFSHSLEEILARLRKHPDQLDTDTRELLQAGFREIGSLIESVDAGETDPRAPKEIIERIRRLAYPIEKPIPDQEKTAEPGLWEIILIPRQGAALPAARVLVNRKTVNTLGNILEEPGEEEQLRGKGSGPQRFVVASTLEESRLRATLKDLPDIQSVTIRSLNGGKRPLPPPLSSSPPEILPRSVRIQTDLLDRLLETTAEIVIHRGRLEQHFHPTREDPIREPLEGLGHAIHRLHDDILAMRLVSFSGVADLLATTVQQVARKKKKTIRFGISGKEVRMDRSIPDRLRDPLLHLIRNSVDHGIETTRDRQAAGKPPEGRIDLSVSRSGQELCVELRDDGRGIDPGKVKRRAREGGWVQESELRRMTEAEVYRLVTLPGFSTKDTADEISGRGIGMDVVAARIRAMGGNLVIESTPGRGTCFRMLVPLTVAVMDGLLIGGRSGWFALPLHQVESTREFHPRDLEVRAGRTHIRIGEDSIRLISLDRVLGGREEPGTKGPSLALILRAGNQRFGLQVDSIQGRRELVLRPLKPPLEAVPEFSGAAVLEDGLIALVLNPPTRLAPTPA